MNIKGTQLSECPVSFILPDSMQLITLVHTSMDTKELAGACLYGTDSGKWPAWYVDAVTVIGSCRQREKEAIDSGRQ